MKNYSTFRHKLQEEMRKDLLDYVKAKLLYKEGDIIEDHIGMGKITKINIYIGFISLDPEIHFICENLTKKGEVSKREPTRTIYYENIKK